MEFDFNINALFSEMITKLDNRLIPNRCAQERNGILKQNLIEVVDKMGDASAKAQGLRGSITSGRKIELSNHNLYMMKDPDCNSGKGAVVGILKTGKKRLFVYDSNGGHHEMEPLCVLDFYVHESRQRTGCGKKLFEFMLQCENIAPCHLAIDRPSSKFSSFLSKHYNLKNHIPQTNNFVVYEGFLKQPDCYVNRRKNGGIINTGYVLGGKEVDRCYPRRANTEKIDSYKPNVRPPSGSNHFLLNRHGSGRNRTVENKHLCFGSKDQNYQDNQNLELNPSDYVHPIHLSSRPPSGTQKFVEPENYVRNRSSSGSHGLHPQSRKRHQELLNIDVLKEVSISDKQSGLQQQHTRGCQAKARESTGALTNNRYAQHTTNIDKTISMEPNKNIDKNNDLQNVTNNINLHQNYLGHGGHLKVHEESSQKNPSLPKINNAGTNIIAPKLTQLYAMKAGKLDQNWTVGNIYHNSSFGSGRHYQSRLW